MTVPVQPIEIVSFPVEGMTCASCVNRITRFLQKVDGVDDANVNLASESATVRFDPSVVSVSDLAAAVDAAGYVARLEQASSGTDERDLSQVAEARSERDVAGARHVAQAGDRRRRRSDTDRGATSDDEVGFVGPSPLAPTKSVVLCCRSSVSHLNHYGRVVSELGRPSREHAPRYCRPVR